MSMLANETLVDVLSYLNRGTLDSVQMVSKSFRDMVDAKLVNVCLRRIHRAHFQRDAGFYTIIIKYGVHGFNEMTIEGIASEVEAVQGMLQICRAATVDVLKLIDAKRGPSIRAATLEALIDCAHAFVVRVVSFDLAELVSDGSFGLFMRALESTNGLKLLYPPSLTTCQTRSLEQYCEKLGIELF